MPSRQTPPLFLNLLQNDVYLVIIILSVVCVCILPPMALLLMWRILHYTIFRQFPFWIMLCKGLVESIRGAGGGDEKSGLRHADYLAIGISSALLGMLYVAGLVGFICYRRRKRQLENVHIKLSTQPSTPVQELGIMRLNPLLQSSRTSSRPASSDPSLNVRPHHRSSMESRSVI